MNNKNENSGTAQMPSRGTRFGRAAAFVAAGALGATALTGVALAQDESESTAPSATEQTQRGPGGPGGHHGPRGGGPGGPGGPMLHSDGVVETEDGVYTQVASQKGEVTDISETSITIVSEDGYSASYTVNGDTEVNKDREDVSISDIAVGDSVGVRAEKDGDALVAKHIGSMSEELRAEMEAQREERMQQFQERQQQDGDQDNAGFTGAGSTATI